MLTNRRIQVLAVLLVVQLAILAVVYWPRPTQATSAPVFANLSSADVNALTISDNGGKEVKLARKGDGWVLPEAGDYPAKNEVVSGLVDKLVALKTGRLVAQTAATYGRLQVAADNFARRLVLETAKGDQYTLYLGTAPSAGATHFRLDGQDQVYLTSDLATFDAGVEPGSFIDTAYLKIPSADIATLKIENDKGTLDFTRQGDQWALAGLPSGQALDQGTVQTLLARLSALAMTRPLGTTADPAWGLAPAKTTVTIGTQPAQGEGKTYTLLIGARDAAANAYYVKSSESPYYVQVAAVSLDEFTGKGISDFIATPTPAPAASSTPAP